MNYSHTDETFQQMSYECQPFPVLCVMCQIADIDTEKNLRAAGWMLTDKTEVCGKCVKRMAAYETESMDENTRTGQKGIRPDEHTHVRTVREWNLPIVRAQAEKALHND